MYPLPKGRAELVPMREGKVEIVRSTGMSCEKYRMQLPIAQLLLQYRQRSERKLVVLRQSRNEAVRAVCAEPEVVPGK